MALQHFVPRFVLRHFCRAPSSGRNKEYINVLDLSTWSLFPATLSRVAGSNRFYDYSTRIGDGASIDPFLKNVEGITAPAWDKLVRAKSVRVLDAVEREAIALFIGTLAIRGPADRAQIESLPNRIIDELRRRGENTVLIEDWFAQTRGDDAEVHASTIENIAPIYPIIAKRIWSLYRPPMGCNFCTSDSPVVRFNELDYGPHQGKLGLLQHGICLEVALSHELLLLIVDGTAYGFTEDNSLRTFSQAELLHYNSSLAAFTHRHLYAYSELDFNDVPRGVWRDGPKFHIY